VTAYYNEIDPKAAAWLRELIKQGHIAQGDVDETDIRDVDPDRLDRYTQCHFFAGIGGWSLALRLAGWPDSRPVWTGSCPCQPFSAAGRRAGQADERHLWPHWHHLISQCQPAMVFGEQVASKDGLGWLDLVQADMEATGYAFAAQDICAAGIGAPHIRQRLWFVGLADANGGNASAEREQRGGQQRQQQEDSGAGCMADAADEGFQIGRKYAYRGNHDRKVLKLPGATGPTPDAHAGSGAGRQPI
jgi:DNA (cytosine-5)-methyltransferase 1